MRSSEMLTFMLGRLHEQQAVQRVIAVPTEKPHGNTVIEICLNNILKCSTYLTKNTVPPIQ